MPPKEPPPTPDQSELESGTAPQTDRTASEPGPAPEAEPQSPAVTTGQPRLLRRMVAILAVVVFLDAILLLSGWPHPKLNKPLSQQARAQIVATLEAAPTASGSAPPTG